MKIIFSRKGFDDAYGASASPILPDGTLLSLPIPTKGNEQGVAYKALSYQGKSYIQIMKELGIKTPVKRCHLDPDLVQRNNKKIKAWMPAFGQQGAAAKHLMNEGVEAGDLFLFFGSFKRTYLDKRNKLNFENDYVRHIIFGFLEVGDCFNINKMSPDKKRKFQWHPHIQNDYGKNNLLFVAPNNSELNFSSGVFKYAEQLVLTRDGYRKSIWELPACFHPSAGTRISRHLKKERFQMRADKTILQTVGIGQDFVVHTKSKAVTKWAKDLISIQIISSNSCSSVS